ncbi:MAG: Rieske 2Fe-2S domain-containing protein [Caldilinea sp.]|nr:Rieske 2Fe-2S domain-containing protein [Caldilinea sp.]MCB0066759.1 Rieske 2Fe-2S domain-containing protein [Caldilineaceae bacterium]MCB9115783.1 Rieske 2Fe-2S domain-containing protein [Caldilineaceae bacterium]MCO5212336.1 Rieske 2Fe-2S domain-containing protein [Caldilinea sp.]MCW5840254.1 Rieske 2Fe-2S domain-containing protein [Caldilinea sp.]
MAELSTQERFKRGAADAGRYFEFMAQFVDFEPDHAEAIRATRAIVEQHIPEIVADIYAQLLSFPSTRKHFLKRDGSIDQEYLEFRMQHQATFWRRTAQGVFDEDYARFLDYVGRAHTSQGADPAIYIPERYVIGMLGFVQQRITRALSAEIETVGQDLVLRAIQGWNTLLVVLQEMLSRVYGEGREAESYEPPQALDDEPLQQLAQETYERSLGLPQSVEMREVHVASVADFVAKDRKIVKAEGLSIGVFFVDGQWHALHNSCLHRGGSVCKGPLENGILTCPWHGYEYKLETGELLLDPNARLPRFPVEIRDGEVYLRVPVLAREEVEISLKDLFANAEAKAQNRLAANEFAVADVKPGQIKMVTVGDVAVAVYNVDGAFFATQNTCTHTGGPLNEGSTDGVKVVCPWHGSCFDVTNGSVVAGPATEPLRTYTVVVEGEIGRVT